jgi:dipeptidyl aminopeptidase/acylaminoacyl peptidase
MSMVGQRGLFGVMLLVAVVPLQAQDDPKMPRLEGIWLGAIKTEGVEIRLAFHVSAKDKQWTASFDVLEQQVKGVPVEKVSFKDGVVRFDLKGNVVFFEGTLSKEGTDIAGTFKQGDMAFPLTLKRVDKLPDLSRPQDPKRPYPYLEEEVTYENKKAGIKLAGTLTLPKGKGPFPAVLLITGSGPQDRDETIFGHKPFLVIADYLTRQGIAVLRVDDRGVGGSTGNTSDSTTDDFAGDVLTGVEFLKGRADIDAKRIGLIGHSEGGIIGPLVASRSKDVGFVIMLAGTGLPGHDILMRQRKLIMEAAGASKELVELDQKYLAMAIPIIEKEEQVKVARERILEEIAAWKAKADPKDKQTLEQIEQRAKLDVAQLTTKWFRYFFSYDPAPALRKVQCPVLVLNGEKDLQVPCKANLNAIAAALKEGGNQDFTIKEFPNLNHLFQTCKTGSPSEYFTIQETIAPVVLETMAEWIKARVK